MESTIAFSSASLDRHTQLITAVHEAPAGWAALASCIAEAIAFGRTRVVVDLAGVGGMQPVLLQSLFRGQRQLSWRGGRLAVVCPPGTSPPAILNGPNGSIPVYSSTDEAYSAFWESAA